MSSEPAHALVQRMLDGDRRALARLFTLLEQSAESRSEIVKGIHPRLSGAYVIGVTGPPGAGKSTIADGLVRIFRESDAKVGVLAVDPSSPFSGGAILGDRVRMRRHYLDRGVFIRSLATRGDQGGLSRVVPAAIRLLDAFGMDVVIVETVGVGQTELEVASTADTVVVTLVPEAGDGVQAMKAGLMEIGDIFVVNKADRPGADRAASDIRAALALGTPGTDWNPPIVMTEAHRGKGVQELHDKLQEHRAILERTSGERTSGLDERRRHRLRREFAAALREVVAAEIDTMISSDGVLSELAARVQAGELDPYAAAAEAVGGGHLVRKTAGEEASRPPRAHPDAD
ncbi:MAG: methylmalonyl Co-A mutase-associated GTPase MeaB [Chloroflexi bacterium]|nr:methylmalonyl Co-A mutase-associated GTPase MeaB [Chloroflexota bacterium]